MSEIIAAPSRNPSLAFHILRWHGGARMQTKTRLLKDWTADELAHAHKMLHDDGGESDE